MEGFLGCPSLKGTINNHPMTTHNKLLALLFLPILGAGHVFAAAGGLDPAFGIGGVVQPNFGSGNTFSFADAAIAPNGDIVVAGTLDQPGIGDFAAIARFLPSGAQDPSFGTNGIVILPPPTSFFLGSSFPLAVAVQANGEILTVFYAFNNTSTSSENLLIRLNTNGTFDSTFGSGGSVALTFPVPTGFGASATIVLAQPDGKILLTGNVAPPFRSKSAPLTLLARYLANGAPDSSFGTGGLEEVVTPIDLPSTVALLSGDALLAYNSAGQVAQFSSNGTLLAAVSGGTIIATKDAGILNGLAILPNGEFLAAGTILGPDGKTNVDAIVERFELTDTLDTSYESPAITFGPNAPEVQNEPESLVVDAEERGLLGVQFVTASTDGAGVARLNANGSLDTTFGTGGVSPTVPNFVLYRLLVQTNNQPVMISGNGSLARYLAQ
jgi:uncharacterized delta-60 repeat protein